MSGFGGGWCPSALVFCSALAACDGGNGSGLPARTEIFGASFSEIQANVLTPTCATSGCHLGAGAPQGLSLDFVNSYDLLVGVPSSQQGSILRVAPGNPDASYLVQKLEGTARTGGQMPLNGAPLAQVTIDTIRQWIAEGAIDDRSESSQPIRVTSIVPVPGATLLSAPAEVGVAFDRAPDASTVNAETFVLQASGGDNVFDDGTDIDVAGASVSVSMANPRAAAMNLAGIALDDDLYRVILRGTGPSIVQDLDANALDGEFDGTFPSGDGTQGGDFMSEFRLTANASSGPTLDAIQAAVFTPTCATAGCHTGPTSNVLPSGMDLTSADASFDALVGVPSLQQPAVLRVAPNDPDGSYLVRKLEGTAGSRMPLGQEPLDAAVIGDIRQWIAEGANRGATP